MLIFFHLKAWETQLFGILHVSLFYGLYDKRQMQGFFWKSGIIEWMMLWDLIHFYFIFLGFLYHPFRGIL